MISIRITYTDNSKDEMKEAVNTLEKDFQIISMVTDYKGKNPKYANSKFKMAYIEAEKRK